MSVEAELVLQVNQQLAFVRVQLQAAQAQLKPGDIHSRLRLHAHLDAAMRQLDRAMVLFIEEVACHSGVSISGVGNTTASSATVTSLLSALKQHNQTVPELNEWLQLQQQPASWLSRFILAAKGPDFVAQQFFDVSGSDSLEEKKNDKTSPQLIATLKSQDPLPLELLQQWLTDLQRLIDRQRENLEEV